MARCDSVTVSMAELTMGMFIAMCRVRQVRVSVSAGSTSLRAGCRSISSKVRPSRIVSWIMKGYFHYGANRYDEVYGDIRIDRIRRREPSSSRGLRRNHGHAQDRLDQQF